MKLSPPKQTSWWTALVVGGIGIIAHYVDLPLLSAYAFWLVVFGFVLLVLATFLKGL